MAFSHIFKILEKQTFQNFQTNLKFKNRFQTYGTKHQSQGPWPKGSKLFDPTWH